MARIKFLLISSLILCNETLSSLLQKDYDKFASTLQTSNQDKLKANFTSKPNTINNTTIVDVINDEEENESTSMSDIVDANTKESSDHEILFSEHDITRDIPTRSKYTASGRLKHLRNKEDIIDEDEYESTSMSDLIDTNTEESSNYEIPFSEHEIPRDVSTRPKYTASGKLKHLKNKEDIVDFVPTKLYAQVRGKHTVKRLPQKYAIAEAKSDEEKENAKRLREVVTNSKVNTVYTEEGYEDSAYDHAGHIRDANFEEDYGRKLDNEFESLKNSKNKWRKKPKYIQSIELGNLDDNETLILGSKSQREEIRHTERDFDPKTVVLEGIKKLEEDLINETEETERKVGDYHDSLSQTEEKEEEEEEEEHDDNVDDDNDDNVEDSKTINIEKSRNEDNGKRTTHETFTLRPRKEQTKIPSRVNTTLNAEIKDKSKIMPINFEDIIQFDSFPYGYRSSYSTNIPLSMYDFSTSNSDSVTFLPITTIPTSNDFIELSWKNFKNRQNQDKKRNENIVVSSEESYTPIALESSNADGYLIIPNEEMSSTPISLERSLKTSNVNDLLMNAYLNENQKGGEMVNDGTVDNPIEIDYSDQTETWTLVNSVTEIPISLETATIMHNFDDIKINTTPLSPTVSFDDDNVNSNNSQLPYEFDINPFLRPFISQLDGKRYSVIVRDRKKLSHDVNSSKSRSKYIIKDRNNNKNINHLDSIPTDKQTLHKHMHNNAAFHNTINKQLQINPLKNEDLKMIKLSKLKKNLKYPYSTSKMYATHNTNKKKRPQYKYKDNKLKFNIKYYKPELGNQHSIFKNLYSMIKLMPPISLTKTKLSRSFNEHVPKYTHVKNVFPYNPNTRGLRVRSKRSIIYFSRPQIIDEESSTTVNRRIEKNKRSILDVEKLLTNKSTINMNLLELPPVITANVINKEIESRFPNPIQIEERQDIYSEEQRDDTVEVEVPELDDDYESSEGEEYSSEDATYIDKNKYPYYSSESTEQDTTLKYILNPNKVPQKTLGGMEFYNSRTRECKAVDPNLEGVVPNEDESRGYNENGPRLHGLGDQLDCFKAKYFDENPLDNPLFTEKQVEQPVQPKEFDSDIFKTHISLFKPDEDEYVIQQLSKKPESNNPNQKLNIKIRVKNPLGLKEKPHSNRLRRPRINQLKTNNKNNRVQRPIYIVPNQPLNPYSNQVYEDVMSTIQNAANYYNQLYNQNLANQRKHPISGSTIKSQKLVRPNTIGQWNDMQNIRNKPNAIRDKRRGLPFIQFNTNSPLFPYFLNMFQPLPPQPNNLMYRNKLKRQNPYNYYAQNNQNLEFYEAHPYYEFMNQPIDNSRLNMMPQSNHRIAKRSLGNEPNLFYEQKKMEISRETFPVSDVNNTTVDNNKEQIIYIIKKKIKNNKSENDTARHGKFSLDPLLSGTADVRRREPRYNPINEHENPNITPSPKSFLRIIVNDPVPTASEVNTSFNESASDDKKILNWNLNKPNKTKVYHEIARKNRDESILAYDTKPLPKKIEKRYEVHENVQDDNIKTLPDLNHSRKPRDDSEEIRSQSDEDSSDGNIKKDNKQRTESSGEDSSSETESAEVNESSKYKSGEEDNERESNENSKEEKSTFARFTSRPYSPPEYYEDEKYEDLGPRVNKPAFYHPPFKIPEYEQLKFGKHIEDESSSRESVESEESEESEKYVFPWEKNKEDEDEKEESKHFVHTIKKYEYPWDKRERLRKEREKKKKEKYYDSGEKDEDIASSEDYETYVPWYLRQKSSKSSFGPKRAYRSDVVNDNEGVSTYIQPVTQSNNKNKLNNVNATIKSSANNKSEKYEIKKYVTPPTLLSTTVENISPVKIISKVNTTQVNYKPLIADGFNGNPNIEILKTNPKRGRIKSNVDNSIVSYSSSTTTEASVLDVRRKRVRVLGNTKTDISKFNTNHTIQPTVRSLRRFLPLPTGISKSSVTPVIRDS